MAVTFEEIMCDAKAIVERLTDQEKTADNLYSEMQSIVCHLNNVKQVYILIYFFTVLVIFTYFMLILFAITNIRKIYIYYRH